MQVDIGMLLEMDTLDRTMMPALHISPDTMNSSTNSTGPITPPNATMNPRSHLNSATNYGQHHDYDGWERPPYQCSVKPWPSTEGSVTYDYSCTKGTTTKHPHHPHGLPRDQLLNIADLSADSSNCTSFSANSTNYGLLNELQVDNNIRSPIQSSEEAQWQMYLTASLSNPLESLAFDTLRSPPTLSYPTDVQDAINIQEKTLPSTEPFMLPDDATFSTSTLHPSAHYQIPYPDGQPMLPDGASVSHMTFDFSEHPNMNDYRGQTVGSQCNVSETVPSNDYTSFMGLSSTKFSFDDAHMPMTGISNETTTIPAVSSPKSPPSRRNLPALAHPSPVRVRRGLSGWAGHFSPEAASGRPFVLNMHKKRQRTPSASPVAGSRRPKPATVPPSGAESEQTSAAQETTLSWRTNGHEARVDEPAALSDSHDFELDSNDGFKEDDAESDDYRPSRSPSVAPSFSSSYPLQFRCETGTEAQGPSKKKARRGKGKAKGSAALALAVVSQLGISKSREGSEQFDDDFDPLVIYREGRHGIRKRKNHPIPLPVPVPNLNKKSRGRKVPYVADVISSGGSASPMERLKGTRSPDENEGNVVRNSGRARRKSSRMPTPVTDELAGSRTYVCVVPGCGKCFVRGEHLKRHVRSIHTHDKPHPCPFEGCDKSFSRRDNLGQHVRIHLQP